MLSALAIAVLSASTGNALVVRSSSCTLEVSAGEHKSPVGQLSSGQVRFGTIDPATFTLKDGGLHDAKGRGCWWTPPTGILQCDVNQVPDSGFSVGCDGAVSYNGQTTFYQCDSGNGQFNIYNEDGHGINCGPVTLFTSQCKPASCSTPPPPPPVSSGCPANLKGAYEFPHLIVPVDKTEPDTAAGTSYFGEVTGDVGSVFNFDIPASDAGKTCSLVFLFPEQKDLQTSSFTVSGDGKVDFARLKGTASQATTYNNMPALETDYGVTAVAPGHSYSVATFDCPAGKAVAFKMSQGGSTSLRFFQDYNPSPIGLYITVC